MNCREFDAVLDRSSRGAEWPAEARQHLADCARCRALSEALSQVAAGAVPESDRSALIGRIVPDLAPVRRLLPLWLNALLLVLCVTSIGALLAAATGNRGWYALGAGQRSAIFLALMSAVAAQSVLTALEMEPGRSRGRILRILRCLVPAAFAAVAFGLFRWGPETGFARHSALCFLRGFVTALVVLAGAWTLVRRGYFVSFRRAGAALGLLAGLGGFLSQELYCPVLETAHVAAAHVGLLAVSSVVGFLVGVLAERLGRS